MAFDDSEATERIEEAMTKVLHNTRVRCHMRTAPYEEGLGRDVLDMLQSVPQLRLFEATLKKTLVHNCTQDDVSYSMTW